MKIISTTILSALIIAFLFMKEYDAMVFMKRCEHFINGILHFVPFGFVPWICIVSCRKEEREKEREREREMLTAGKVVYFDA